MRKLRQLWRLVDIVLITVLYYKYSLFNEYICITTYSTYVYFLEKTTKKIMG